MFIQSIKVAITSLSMAAVLTACNGGGPAATDAAGTPAGAEAPISSVGVITGFGSVFLDGVKYEVEKHTRVSIGDGIETVGDDSPLRLGMKVQVRARKGENGQRYADRIEYEEDLRGPIRAVAVDGSRAGMGEFSVLGQKVTVDANTIIDNGVGDNNGDGCLDYNDLNGGMVAKVSGFPLDNGILATRIDRIAGGGAVDEVKVKGKVTGVSKLPASLELNGSLVVNLSGALFRGGLSSAGDLVMDKFIEIEGARVSDTVVNARLVESAGEVASDARRGEYEIAGILQSVDTAVNPHEIAINGITFRVTDAGRFMPLVGKQIVIKGRIDANDVLVLNEGDAGVTAELENSVHTYDLLTSVDTGNDTLLSRLGLEIVPSGRSRVADATRGHDNMHLDDFITGLQGKGTSAGLPVAVDTRGFPEGNRVTWTRVGVAPVERGRGMICMIRGPVESVDPGSFTFTIQGVTVNASGAGGEPVEYRDDREEGRQTLSRAEFFERLDSGAVVMAVGNTEKEVSSSDCTNLSLVPDFVGFRDQYGVFGTVSR